MKPQTNVILQGELSAPNTCWKEGLFCTVFLGTKAKSGMRSLKVKVTVVDETTKNEFFAEKDRGGLEAGYNTRILGCWRNLQVLGRMVG